jgi:4-amino-4-deoxy-L-arabinose transferase-like glycosyltransferase
MDTAPVPPQENRPRKIIHWWVIALVVLLLIAWWLFAHHGHGEARAEQPAARAVHAGLRIGFIAEAGH